MGADDAALALDRDCHKRKNARLRQVCAYPATASPNPRWRTCSIRKAMCGAPSAASSISASSASRGGASTKWAKTSKRPLDRKSLRAHALFVPPQLHLSRQSSGRRSMSSAPSLRGLSRQREAGARARPGLAWRGSLSDRAIRKQTSMPRLIAAAPASGRPARIARRSRRVLPTPVCTALQPACQRP